MRRRGLDNSYSKFKYNKHRMGFGEEVEKKYCPKCGKICFTKKEAMTAINFAKRRGDEHHKTPIRCYYCKDCSFWHLTSQEKRETDSKEF